MFRQLTVLLGLMFASQVFAEDNILTWDHDGIDLAGFYVYHKIDAGPYTRVATTQDETLRTYIHADQPDGDHCYQVSAFGLGQFPLESGLSNESCKTVPSFPTPFPRPNDPSNLQVN